MADAGAGVERRVVRAGPARHPRRRRLAGPLLRLGRRHALHRRLAARAPTWSTPRGTATSTSSSPTAPSLLGHAHPVVTEAVADAAAARHDLRGADAGRGPAGRGDLRAGARLRAGAARVVGDRGGHERRAPGPRRHRARPGRQVRRLLPRPLRRPAGRRGQRRGHARPARLGRRVRRRGGRHRGRALQRGARARRATWPA